MTEDEKQDERRRQGGTRFWIGLNLLLFPIPSHFSLLRAREFSLKKSFFHFGMTLVLSLILMGAAVLQVLLPGIGRLWLLLPLASGIMLAAFNHQVIAQFEPMRLEWAGRKQMGALLLLLAILTVINIIPELDLIELKDRTTEPVTAWIKVLPVWQSALIFLAGMLVVVVGHAGLSRTSISLNRIIILYACFIVIAAQVGLVLLVACKWLKYPGGFLMEFAAVLLAAILALDYWDAASFGQFTRRYVLLTCTKGLSFIFLLLCFLGFPQKIASSYMSYCYNNGKPLPGIIPLDRLVFTDQGSFQSAHISLSRMRKLYAEALMGIQPETTGRISRMMEAGATALCPAGDDICRLKELPGAGKSATPVFTLDTIPFFRPVEPAWDVFLATLIHQHIIAEEDLAETIAGFKAILPKSLEGRLPDLDTAYDIRYVALAAKARLHFIPPAMEHIERLLQNNLTPILSLPLTGESKWGALLFWDKSAGLAWFRIQNSRAMEKTIQTLFDANISRQNRAAIQTYQMIPLPQDYLATIIAHIDKPMVVLSQDGFSPDLLKHFGEQALGELETTAAWMAGAKRTPEILSKANAPEFVSDYARYLQVMVRLNDLITPKRLDFNLFPDPQRFNSDASWADRFQRAEKLIQGLHSLRDMDRMRLAGNLVENNQVDQAPELFLRLALPRPVSTNLVGCCQAFKIGRRLFLMGRYPEAQAYLSISQGRHPFNSEYEIWHHLAGLKQNQVMGPFRSMPEQQPGPWLYYQTLADMQKGKAAAALKRLKKVIARDSHDSMANHLLEKYFQQPVDARYFFPAPEGL